MNRNQRALSWIGILLVAACVLGTCLNRHFHHPLRVQVLPLSASAYYIGLMVIRFCDGATGRWQPPQTYGYEARIGLFDMQYRKQ